jgi:formylmethanofuran dehydrogenase subunit E
MGLYAGELLGLALPQPHKQLLTIVETDGCFADGVSVATNCWTGRRTLRVEDYGKVAATFIDTATDRAFRLAPPPAARTRAAIYAPAAPNRWEAMLHGYQVMPTAELLVATPVTLRTPASVLLSRPGARALCAACGEEILNDRQVTVQVPPAELPPSDLPPAQVPSDQVTPAHPLTPSPRTLCRSCAAGGYWLPAP